MRIQSLQAAAVALACAGMLFQPAAMAAPQAMITTDIALRDGGVLVGQVVDGQGVALARTPVAVLQNNKEIARVETDKQGTFAVAGLKGGVYQVASLGHQGVYRLWAAQTAPPAAKKGLIMVSGNVVRGQGPFSTVTGWISEHPLMTTAILATAIAVPLAIDDDNPSSP